MYNFDIHTHGIFILLNSIYKRINVLTHVLIFEHRKLLENLPEVLLENLLKRNSGQASGETSRETSGKVSGKSSRANEECRL